jgi:hypothetical protein
MSRFCLTVRCARDGFGSRNESITAASVDCLFTSEVLPSLHSNVYVLGIDLNHPRTAASLFRRK